MSPPGFLLPFFRHAGNQDCPSIPAMPEVLFFVEPSVDHGDRSCRTAPAVIESRQEEKFINKENGSCVRLRFPVWQDPDRE